MNPILLPGHVTRFGTLREGISQKTNQPYAFLDIEFEADCGSRVFVGLRDDLARRTNELAVLHGDGTWLLAYHLNIYQYTNRNGYPAYGNDVIIDDFRPQLINPSTHQPINL